jgi:hypothetical protein
MFGYGSMGEKRTVVCQVGNFPVRYKYHEGEFGMCRMILIYLIIDAGITNAVRRAMRATDVL